MWAKRTVPCKLQSDLDKEIGSEAMRKEIYHCEVFPSKHFKNNRVRLHTWAIFSCHNKYYALHGTKAHIYFLAKKENGRFLQSKCTVIKITDIVFIEEKI